MMYNNTRDTKYSEIVYNYQISNYAKKDIVYLIISIINEIINR